MPRKDNLTLQAVAEMLETTKGVDKMKLAEMWAGFKLHTRSMALSLCKNERSNSESVETANN